MFGPRSCRSCRAFTLVEILVALVIIGIASAIIVPQLGSRGDVLVSAAARSVTADLMYAQNQSLAEQKPFYVKFSSTGYSLFDDSAMTTPITHPVKKDPFTVTTGPGGTRGFEQITFGTVNFSTQQTFGFDELGSPFVITGGIATPITSPGTIPLNSGPSNSLTISVAPYTGQITIN